MVNKCVVTSCSTVYKTSQKKASFHFHEDQKLKQKWIYFVNGKNCLPTTNSVICIDQKFMKLCEKFQLLCYGNCIHYLQL